MVKINSIKAVVQDSQKRKFGFNFEFQMGLNILSGDNSSGKSTVLSCIYYCLGMEQLMSFGSADGLKECLKSQFRYDGIDYQVYSSYAELNIQNSNGDIAVIKRTIRTPFTEDLNVLEVTTNDGDPELKFVHAVGDTEHEDGFFNWLSRFSGIIIPTYTDDEGHTTKILYLQQIFASSFVEQTKGWSDFFAQVPHFNTKKAKQKIIEYTLGLTGLVEEFEYDKLKEQEKKFKTNWSSLLSTFKAISSYYNFLPAGLPDNFTMDISSARIEKYTLQTRLADGLFVNIDDMVTSYTLRLNSLEKKNEVDNTAGVIAGTLTEKHLDLKRDLSYLNKEFQKIVTEKVNEDLKRSKFRQTLVQIEQEIAALDGINKLNKLSSFKLGDVENCPVCNSSLLTNPDIELQNIEKIDSVKSLPFYKSERSLYVSYLENSEDLVQRFEKMVAYYQDRIAETKQMLDLIDRQLLTDARIPSRVDISEELMLKFELQKLGKVKDLFAQLKIDLDSIAIEMATIKIRKSAILANRSIDAQKVYTFKDQFVAYLKDFGYSREIISRVFISTDEQNKLFPVVSVPGMSIPQPIRLASSASDFIRAQWAFYLTLLKKAQYHLGVLVLDEPGQHAMKSADMTSLLKAISLVKDRQVILAISKQDNSKDDKIILATLLDRSGLKIDVDYKLNIIDDHDRIDKCIQPLPPEI